MNRIKKVFNYLLLKHKFTIVALVLIVGTQYSNILNSFKQTNTQILEVELKDLNNKTVRFPFKEKTSIIFWASWCGPCHVQMKLLESLKPKEQKIYAISLGESLDTVQKYLRKTPTNLTVLIDTKNTLRKDYSIQVTPTLMLVNEKNTIEYFTFGISPLFSLRSYLHLD